jgi:hypothetical protein
LAKVVRSPANSTKSGTEKTFENMDAVAYMPVVRSGGWADIGSRHTMEDVFICSDNLMKEFGVESFEDGPSAFYGVCFYSTVFKAQTCFLMYAIYVSHFMTRLTITTFLYE